MVERVREGTVVFSWGGGLTQVGTSPEHSFTLVGLDADLEWWLRKHLDGTPLPASRKLTAAQKRVVRQMRHHGLVESGASSALSRLRIRIMGLDRITIPLTRTLVAQGARFLDLRDSQIVNDEVSYLFPLGDQGSTRHACLKAELVPRGALLGKSTHPQLIVTTESHLIEPLRAGNLLYRDTPQLPIILDDRSIQVGPLLVPGSTPCFECLDLHRQEQLPRWPELRAHLLQQRPPEPEPALASLAAGLAANVIGSALMPPPPSAAVESTDASHRPWYSGTAWRVHETGVECLHWDHHPQCGCVPARLLTR